MDQLAIKLHRRKLRKNRIRTQVNGTPERPRLSVFVSNRHISAQLINDESRNTMAAITTVGQKVGGAMTEQAVWVGAEMAKKAKALKVKKVVFDRNGRLYHGRIKALAEALRKEGLDL